MIDDFAADGQLAKAIPGFKPREPQRQMAVAVSEAIEASRPLVVEAGTGTGKTYAYLAPALRAKKKVIISTGSKALQDQLYSRDLPTVAKALKFTGKLALLKGRSNYLCLERLERQALAGGDLPVQTLSDVILLRSWSNQTQDGDISTCASVAEDSQAWPLVTSTNDNCLGSDCPLYKDCFVVKARKKAMDADVVVVNHHLFLADMVVKESGFAELIPEAEVMIFDEAHQRPVALQPPAAGSGERHHYCLSHRTERHSTAAKMRRPPGAKRPGFPPAAGGPWLPRKPAGTAGGQPHSAGAAAAR